MLIFLKDVISTNTINKYPSSRSPEGLLTDSDTTTVAWWY